MNYGELIGDAVRISWRNKFLWFFGFFAGGTGANLFTNVPSGAGNLGGDPEQTGAPGLAAQVGPGVFENVALTVLLFAVGGLILLLLAALVLVSQGALAENVAAIDRGEGRGFGAGWRAGLGNFWRVLGYSIVFVLISLGLLIAVGAPLALLLGGTFAATESVGARVAVGLLAGGLGVLLLIAIFVPLAIVRQYGLRELVVRRTGVFASFGGGYRIFRRTLGRSLLVWLVNLGLAIAVGVAVLLGLAIVALVMFLPAIALGFAGAATAAVVAGVVAGVVLLPILLAVSGATGAFFHSYWTLAYLRLTAPETAPSQAPA